MIGKLKFIHSKEEWDFHYTYHVTILNKNKNIGNVTLSVTLDDIQIIGMYVQPQYRGQGIGEKLMRELEKIYSSYDKISLKVRRDNISAVNLYKKFGFKFYSIEEPGIYQWMIKINKIK